MNHTNKNPFQKLHRVITHYTSPDIIQFLNTKDVKTFCRYLADMIIHQKQTFFYNLQTNPDIVLMFLAVTLKTIIQK